MASFEFTASLTEAEDIHLVLLTNNTTHQIHLSTEPKTFTFEIDEDIDQDIKFVMSNKLPNANKFDSSGNFIRNPMIKITEIKIENFNIDHWVSTFGVYKLDEDPNKQEKFYEYMGCNGIVGFTIRGPLWQWLLENIS